MEQAVFRHTHRVTYAECTLGNHVYYSRYLDLLEAARNEFFRHLGAPFLQLQEQGVLFPVLECHLRYHAPARYDDLLTIEVRLAQAERARLRVACRVLNQAGSLLVEAETQHVCTDLQNRPRRLPADLCERLRPWVCGSQPAAQTAGGKPTAAAAP